jgi:flagellar biosynthesis protein FlhB
VSEKPLDATPQRLERARREGDLPRANEFVALGAFAGGSLGCAAAAAPLAALGRLGITAAARGGWPAWFGLACALALLPALGAAGGAVLAFVAVQGRIRVQPLKLDASRLSPAAGIKRIASRETALAVARAVVAGGALAAAFAPIALDALDIARGPASPERLAAAMLSAATRMIVVALLLGLCLAAADAALGRAAWRRRLRMDHAEMKAEMRRTEGDPALRGRRRRTHANLARTSLRRLREASFVVVNPEHVAVALAYRPPTIAVPRVVVRARGDAALAVKRRARDLALPIVEAPGVARMLFAMSEDGAYVPRELYAAVARIVAALQTTGKIA